MGMFRDDFTDCKYQKGQHVVPRYLAGNPHATVWRVVSVAKNHGGQGHHYYRCEAPGYGSQHLYEDHIALTDRPVSDFWAGKEKPAGAGES